MPVAELVTFVASDEYLADPIAATAVSNGLMFKQPGLIPPVYYGIQHENKNTAVVFLNWESVEDHTNVGKCAEFEQIMSEFTKIYKDAHEFQHIEINDTAALKAALSAPATEIAIMKVKPESTKEAFLDVGQRLIDGLKKEPTCHGITFGESVENKGTYIVVAGWDSVEAHFATAAKDIYAAGARDLRETSDVTLMHTSFTAVEKN